MKARYIFILSLFTMLMGSQSSFGQVADSSSGALHRIVVFYGDVYVDKMIEISMQLDKEFEREQSALKRDHNRLQSRIEQGTIGERQALEEYDKQEKTRASIGRRREARESEIKRSLQREFELFKKQFSEANNIVLVDVEQLGRNNVWSEDGLVVEYENIFRAFDSYRITRKVPVWGSSVNIVASKIAYVNISRLRKELLWDGVDGMLSDHGHYALRWFAKRKGYKAAIALKDSAEQAWRHLPADDLTASFQTEYDSGDLSQLRRMDGFLGIRFGASKSQVQEYLSVNKLGRIVEAESSSKSSLVVDQLELDYGFLDGRRVRAGLSFFNDKFFRLMILIPKEVSFGDVVSDLNRRFYEIDLDDFDFGVYSWRFRQDGHSNTVKISRGTGGLIFDSYNESLFNEAGEAYRKGLWP